MQQEKYTLENEQLIFEKGIYLAKSSSEMWTQLNDSIYYFYNDNNGRKIDLMEYKMQDEKKAPLKTVWDESDDDQINVNAIIFVENITGKS